jgi:hypothetical protein
MESILFALDLVAVVVLCHFATKQDDAEQLKAKEQEKHDA